MSSWFRAQASGERCADVWIDKAIGSDWAPDWWADLTGEQTARQFIDAVEGLGDLDEITVHLNSPGGEVAAGMTIMNYLRNHKATVHMRVEGTAASIASVILMAGDTRTMGVGATVMTHDPAGWMGGYYTEAEMRERADGLASIKNSIVEAYMAGTGATEDVARELMANGDNYHTADEAIAAGLATAKDDTFQAVASADFKMYQAQIDQACQLKQATQQLAAKDATIAERDQTIAELNAPPAVADAATVIAQCSESGFSDLAAKMVAEKFTAEAVAAQLDSAKSIRDICKASGIDHAPLIAQLSSPAEMLRVGITDALALADQDLDSHIPPGSGNHSKQPSSESAYNQLNNRG